MPRRGKATCSATDDLVVCPVALSCLPSENHGMEQASTHSPDLSNAFKLGPLQIGSINFAFLLLTVIAQAVTIFITWDVWQSREFSSIIPNVPWFPATPQFNFGYLLLATLALTLISPRNFGLTIHIAILAIAIASDQMRCQPQVIAIATLMTACVFPNFKRIAVWYLVAMWSWAGIHKLLSPDWMGEVSYYMLLREEFNWGFLQAWDYHFCFAVVIAVAELGLGLLAWRRPRLAAPLCFISHIGIAGFLIVINWNFSVLPWNFCTAIVGAWLLWTISEAGSSLRFPVSKISQAVVVALLIIPIGFYFGFVRHSLSHVLYSSNFPDAVITTADGARTCEAIKELRVPFPHEQTAFLDLFNLVGQPGQKLAIREYRRGMKSRYFVMDQEKSVREITRDEFMQSQNETLPGIPFDDRRKLFQLDKAFHVANADLSKGDPAVAKILKRESGQMAWAIQFNPTSFNKQWLTLLDGLPNLEQIQLGGCKISDQDLQNLSGLIRLQGIGLSDTEITDEGLKYLQDLPLLNFIERDQTQITEEAVDQITGNAVRTNP